MTASSLVAEILQGCVAAAPQPWRPADLLARLPEDREDILFALEALCRAQVLQIVVDQEHKPCGFLLDPHVAERARDPDFAARFCEIEGLDFSGPSTTQRRVIRKTLLTPSKPRMNRVVLWLNIAVFGLGMILAARLKVAGEFFLPMRLQAGNDVFKVLQQTGAVSRVDILYGEWWRLLSCGFVHIGVLHLFMNMCALRVLGGDCEWIWGPKRYLVLYLLSILGGSCAALTTADAVAGASSGLCGLLAAMGVWIILNRRHLPRRMVQTNLRGLVLSGLLIVAISLLPGISAAGHLGGAVVGLVVALLFHHQQLGSPVVSKLAVIGLLAIPVACVLGLSQISQHDPAWQELRILQLHERFRKLYEDDSELRDDLLAKLLRKEPRERDDDKVEEALGKLSSLIRRYQEASDKLEKLKSLRTPIVVEFRQASLDYFRLQAAFMGRIEVCLEKKARWTEKEDRALDAAQQRWVESFRALKKVRP